MPSCFPTPHTDADNSAIDLNAILYVNQKSSIFLRMNGDAMDGIGIYEGDILIVDRSVKPAHDRLVLAILDGENMIRRLHKRGSAIRLIPENGKYQVIDLVEGMELQILGVVTARIRSLV